MIHIDNLTFTVLFYAVMFLVFVIVLLTGFLKSLYSAYGEIYHRVGQLEIHKQDDTSAYITDEEWTELSKQYGFDWDIKPYHKITRNSAIRLLEYLKAKKED